MTRLDSQDEAWLICRNLVLIRRLSSHDEARFHDEAWFS